MTALGRALAVALIWLVLSAGYLSASANSSDPADTHVSTETNVSNEISDSPKQGQIERSPEAKKYFEQIQDVLDREEFGETKTVEGWRAIDTENKEARKEKFPEWIISFLEFMEGAEGSSITVSKVFEVLLWCFVIGLIVFVIYRYREQITSFVSGLQGSQEDRELPTTLFGLDVKKTSLPKDIVGTAQEFWLAGDHRQALATLLRASLIKLLHEHECQFYDSDTEAECCARIDQQAPPPMSHYMHSLVAVWQQVAYAHRVPEATVFDTLCQRWKEVFK